MEVEPTSDDVDLLHHVSNVCYVDWVQRAAWTHSLALGYGLPFYLEEIGGFFMIKRHEIDYLRQAYAGERMRVETWVDSWKLASCVRATAISRIADAAGKPEPEPVLLVRGRTHWAYVDAKKRRPGRIPAELKTLFSRPVPADRQNRYMASGSLPVYTDCEPVAME